MSLSISYVTRADAVTRAHASARAYAVALAAATALLAQATAIIALAAAAMAGDLASLRALFALFGAVLLVGGDFDTRWRDDASVPEEYGATSVRPRAIAAVLLAGAVVSSAVASLAGPPHARLAAAAAASGSFVAGLCWTRGSVGEAPIVLATIAVPIEHSLGPWLDSSLQTATAWCAVPLVALSQSPVSLVVGEPSLRSGSLVIHVSSLCAGSQTLLGVATVAVVLAAVALPRGRHRRLLVAVALPLAFVVNVVRVAISSAVAIRLGGGGPAWDTAHDILGYGTFAVAYGGLVALTLVWRRHLRAATRARQGGREAPECG